MLPMLQPHNDIRWPIFSRRRNIQALTNVSSWTDANGNRKQKPTGSTWFNVDWVQNVSTHMGDKDRKQAFRELEVVRELTGEVLPYDPAAENTTRDPVSPTTMGVLGEFNHPTHGKIKAGETIYMRIPPKFLPKAGMADWNYSVSGMALNPPSYAYLNTTPGASYRKENQPAGWIVFLSAIGEYPLDFDHPLTPVREYYIRTMLPTTTPDNGWHSYYPKPELQGVSNLSTFWSNNAAALKLLLQDLQPA